MIDHFIGSFSGIEHIIGCCTEGVLHQHLSACMATPAKKRTQTLAQHEDFACEPRLKAVAYNKRLWFSQ